jgi:2-phospho-L-lactate guanylyltransferase
MTRLARDLSIVDRRALGRELAGRVVLASRSAGIEAIVVTTDESVRRWAMENDVDTVTEPSSGGLDGAASKGVTSVTTAAWLVVHGDLPAITADDLAAAADLAVRGVVLAPSHDGGTSLVGGTGDSFPFRYGPGSFRRHLAAVRGRASILIRPGLALDLDRPWDLAALEELGYLDNTASRQRLPTGPVGSVLDDRRTL